jgi:hypothetical protein
MFSDATAYIRFRSVIKGVFLEKIVPENKNRRYAIAVEIMIPSLK